jgi:hypothetical protein
MEQESKELEQRIKGFDKDLQCRGMQFEIGKEYKIESTDLEVCTAKVFHYCKTLKDVNNYYSVKRDNRFCYIEVLGEEVRDEDKCGSNHIRVVREIVGEELDMLLGKTNGNTGYFNAGRGNSGDHNLGERNSGDRNSGACNSGCDNAGYRNSGDDNSGSRNTGCRNSGDYNSGRNNAGDGNSGSGNSGSWNSGDRNTGSHNSGTGNSGDGNSGDRNTGDYNAGNRNSGDWNPGDCNSGSLNVGYGNSGNRNTGDWNSCNNSSGFFCSKEPKAIIFNTETDMTISEFRNSIYYEALTSAPFVLVEKIDGELIQCSYKNACKKWWDAITPKNKKVIQSMPNFNAKIFEEITGITIRNKRRSKEWDE